LPSTSSLHHLCSDIAAYNINFKLCSEILARRVLAFFLSFVSCSLRVLCFALLHLMSPSQDGDSTLEPTAGSNRDSLVNYPAAEEYIHSVSTMHAYERAGNPQIPHSYPESGIKRTQTTADSQTAEAGQYQRADTADYFTWKTRERISRLTSRCNPHLLRACYKSPHPVCSGGTYQLQTSCTRSPSDWIARSLRTYSAMHSSSSPGVSLIRST
jgi:hypothetical protein